MVILNMKMNQVENEYTTMYLAKMTDMQMMAFLSLKIESIFSALNNGLPWKKSGNADDLTSG